LRESEIFNTLAILKAGSEYLIKLIRSLKRTWSGWMEGNIFYSLSSNPVWEGNGKCWYFQEGTTCLAGGQSSWSEKGDQREASLMNDQL